MSKIDKLKETYVADAEMMASKSRFGYFSLLPSHTAAITDTAGSVPHRDQDGKVHTQPRNIYSGINSTGSLKKNYFSYTPSAFHGSPYEDPGKHQRKQELEESKKWKGKQLYRPARLNQTLTKAPYEYISDTDPKKGRKNYRGSDGKVITQNCNVLTSPQAKIDYLKNKQFKYTECPPAKKPLKIEKKDEKSQDEPFKTGSPHKQLFTSNSEAFFDANIKKNQSKKQLLHSASHDNPFKPSCISPGKAFTPVVYKEEGNGKEQVKPIKKQNKQQKTEPFKLIKVEHNSKPTPSISLSKINLLRGYR